MTQSDRVTEAIELPLMAIYLACRIAHFQKRVEDARTIHESLVRHIVEPEAQELWHSASSGMPDSIIPFRRDSLDVAAACVLMSSASHTQFRLFSICAVVEAGFFLIDRKSFGYVDRIQDRPDRVAATEILMQDRVSTLVQTALQIDERPSAAIVPNEGDSLLIFDATVSELCKDSKDALDVDVCLVTRPKGGKNGGSPRRLSSAKLTRRPNGEFYLTTRPEHTLQIHAAALAGQWIILISPAIRLLIPPPDFSHEGSSVKVWVEPSNLMATALGVNAGPRVSIDQNLANCLMARHRWCAPQEPANWVAAVSNCENHNADE